MREKSFCYGAVRLSGETCNVMTRETVAIIGAVAVLAFISIFGVGLNIA